MSVERTYDLRDRAEEIRAEELPEVEESIDDLVAAAAEEYGEWYKVPAAVRSTYETLEGRKVELEGQADAIERVVEEWGGGEHVIGELTAGQLARVRDEISGAAVGAEVDPGEGAAQIRIVEEALIGRPSGAPEEVAEYPSSVVEPLFAAVNAVNTVGDVSMGNLSLRERMNRRGASETGE